MVKQSVKNSAYDSTVIIENLRPVFESSVVCKYDRTRFISFRYNLKQQICSLFINWQVSKFINNYNFWQGIFFQNSIKRINYRRR